MTLWNLSLGEVHNETSMSGNWESYPLRNRKDRGFRGFRENANYYVPEEDERLLQFIIRKGLERYVKGKSVWVMMERENALGNRTWQSLKERFLKAIMKKLDTFHWLEDVHKERLRKGAAMGEKRGRPGEPVKE